MVEAMTEIQGRADSMMEEIKAREASISIVNSNTNTDTNTSSHLPCHSLVPFDIIGVSLFV